MFSKLDFYDQTWLIIRKEFTKSFFYFPLKNLHGELLKSYDQLKEEAD